MGWIILIIVLVVWTYICVWARDASAEYETNQAMFRYECYVCGTFHNNTTPLCNSCRPSDD